VQESGGFRDWDIQWEAQARQDARRFFAWAETRKLGQYGCSKRTTYRNPVRGGGAPSATSLFYTKLGFEGNRVRPSNFRKGFLLERHNFAKQSYDAKMSQLGFLIPGSEIRVL
jgi:hypothetical protein